MSIMTDEAAKKIAESTIKKYENADRKVFIILDNDSQYWSSGTMNGIEVVEATLNLIYKLTGDDAEAFLKDAAKQAKQLRKTKEKNAKH